MSSCDYVVAIGASAGGLDPCERFFHEAPTGKGFAYVVIQHLSPDFRSLMDELLARHSSMPIHRVENGMEIEPDTIYLNRPRQILTVENGKFVVSPDEGDDILRLPIDSFFESIAADLGEKAIAVILSGSGSDGAKGAREIKMRGGRVFVQSPESAKFESMPMSVVNSKIADGIAGPDELPSLISEHVTGTKTDASKEPRAMTGDTYHDILELLQERFGTNFEFYKPETTKRRLERRLELAGFQTLEQYYEALLEDEQELETIYADLLIEVTSFFRDHEAFTKIENTAIPQICAAMTRDHQIRMWVPGCASGEEAYSLAMLVAEYARENNLHFNLKILATDVHQRSLSAASAGIYSADALAKVPKERVERYFEQTGEYYQVRPALRRSVVFSPHDLLTDPPFTRMDLVSCRNVLIYLTESAQRKVLTMFHFSLRKHGVLFLGPSETTGRLSQEFTTVSQRWRIFEKKRNVRIFEPSRALASPRAMQSATNQFLAGAKKEKLSAVPTANEAVIAEALQSLLKIYAPAGFLVSQNARLVHVFGDGRKFLTVSEGSFSDRLTDLLPAPLSEHASAMLERFRHGIVVENARAVDVDLDGETRHLKLSLQSLSDEEKKTTGFAIFTIEEDDALTFPVPEGKLGHVADDELISSYARRVSELEHALQTNEETLQSTIEEMETSNEELQATNEELMSANEELQSTNEELHSVNEELYTVSAEHQRKIEELTELTSDMDHLLKSTNIGTLFLDENLNVRRFTPAASRTFNLIAQDIGRPFHHITARFADVNVVELATKVRDSKEPQDREIIADGRAYLMRVLPYVADAEFETGVVFTTIDVEELKIAQRQITEMTQFHSDVLRDIGQIVCRWTQSSKDLVFFNTTFAERFGIDEKTASEAKITDYFDDPSWAAVEAKLHDVQPGAYVPVRFQQTTAFGGIREFRGLVRAIQSTAADEAYFQFTGDDATADIKYIDTLEEVLNVDFIATEADLQLDRSPEEQRISILIDNAKAYLGADIALMKLVREGESSEPLTLGTPDQFEGLPNGAYGKLDQLLSEAAAVADSSEVQLRASGSNKNHARLMADMNAHRALLAPVVARDMAIGSAVFVVRDTQDPMRGFSPLEVSMMRIILKLIGFIWDRHRRLEELRATSEQLQLIFNNVSSRIWYKDESNRILMLNQAAAQSMGITMERATGADAAELFPEVPKAQFDEDLRIIKSGKPKLGELQNFHRADGEQDWVRVDRIPYVDPETGKHNLLVVATDISELMEREAELKSLNSRLDTEKDRHKALYLRTPAMMFSTTLDRQIHDVNMLLASRGGYQPDEMLEHSFDTFFRAAEPMEEDEIDGLIEDENTRPYYFRCKSGEELEVELAGIDDHDDSVVGVRRLWVVHDVSDRNAALKSLNDQNEELAKLNDGLAQFAYAASHDLQEPLRKISQYGDLLLEEHRKSLGEEGQFFVDVMTSSAQRMSGLIKSLLVFSSAAKGDLSQEQINLNALFDLAVEEHKDLVAESGATLIIGTLPKVDCDANLIQIVVSNLILNALKYRAPRRKLQIKVSAEIEENAAKKAHKITIEDNGRGFDAGDSERIFEPFARLVPKSQVTGSGIGLAICRTICERHGWQIEATGSTGKGATFLITIPAGQEQ